jgi:hypothetical protein
MPNRLAMACAVSSVLRKSACTAFNVARIDLRGWPPLRPCAPGPARLQSLCVSARRWAPSEEFFLSRAGALPTRRGLSQRGPFRDVKTSSEIIRLAVLLYVRVPLWLWTVEDLRAARGVEVSHETVRAWWPRVGLLVAAEIRTRRVSGLRASCGRGRLGEVVVRGNGVQHDLWRVVDLVRARGGRRSSPSPAPARPPSPCAS